MLTLEPIPQTGPSRLPISLDVVRSGIDTFAQLDAEQLSFVAGSNVGLVQDEYGALAHLFNLWEEDWRPPLHWERPPYPSFSKYPFTRRFRAALALGEVMVRGQEEVLAQQGMHVPEVHFSPLRSYLAYPEERTGDSFRRYHVELHRHGESAKYLDHAVERGYFAESEAADAFDFLYQAWRTKQMELLHPDEPELSQRESFGEMIRAVFRLFRLYRIGEQEACLAPWEDQVFSPDKHQLLDAAPGVSYNSHPAFAYLRRWVGGLTVRTKSPKQPEQQHWSTIARRGWQIKALHCCLQGEVASATIPSATQWIGFKASLQTVALQPGDVLVTCHEHDRGYEYGELHAPFVVQRPDTDILAWRRGGRVALVGDPGILSPDRGDLLKAINKTLTGDPLLSEETQERTQNPAHICCISCK